MDDDERCCGTGTCLINAEGLCWCGQQWDGEKMCFGHSSSISSAPPATAAAPSGQPAPSAPQAAD